MKKRSNEVSILGMLAHRFRRITGRGHAKSFPGSEKYWEQRYASGGDSGVGSYDKFAEFKADIINGFVTKNGIRNVIEFGCGDGNQLSLAGYPEYIGFDVSQTVIDECKKRFAGDGSKTFKIMKEYSGETADLSLSLDVIYHLIEDEIFESYMSTLFGASSKYVIVYSSNFDNNEGNKGVHVRHREFTKWIQDNAPQWKLFEHIPNRYPYTGDYKAGSFADFYIYVRA